MANTSLTLSEYWGVFIKNGVSSGRYHSASDVVRDAFCTLEERKAKLNALRSRLSEGAEQSKRGKLVNDSPNEMLGEFKTAVMPSRSGTKIPSKHNLSLNKAKQPINNLAKGLLSWVSLYFKEARVKKFLVATLAVILIVAAGLFGFVKIISKPLPSGEAGANAEALANEMLVSINHKAWLETGAIRWNFGGRQQHLWDRERHLAKVEWDNIVVLINLSTRQGVVYQDGQTLSQDKEQYLEQAWAHWANDSFWLNPISKVFDEGTSRQLITMEDGLRGLLITYASGGVTPGDSYLWVVDSSGLPVRFDMWVSIIPIDGFEASWEDWTTLETGVKVSQKHDLSIFQLELTDIKAAATLAKLEGEQDPFAPLFINSANKNSE